MQSPTTAAPKLLQLQRPISTSGDGSSNAKENGLGSPRRSVDSSSGSIRSDSSSIHPLKYTWVFVAEKESNDRHSGVCIVNRVKVLEMQVLTLLPTRK